LQLGENRSSVLVAPREKRKRGTTAERKRREPRMAKRKQQRPQSPNLRELKLQGW
jgi:hypothetical protein